MEQTTPDSVSDAVRAAIDESFAGSVRAASIEAAIPYATLDRRLKDGEGFTVGELRRLAKATGRAPSAFLKASA